MPFGIHDFHPTRWPNWVESLSVKSRPAETFSFLFLLLIYIGFVIDQIFSLIYWNLLLFKFSLIYWGKKIFWNINWNFSYILEFSIIYIVFVIGQFFFSQLLAIIVLELYKHGCKDLLLHDSTKVVLILCWKLRKTTWISNSEIHKHVHMNRLRNSPHNVTCSRYCLGQILNHTNYTIQTSACLTWI